MGINMNIRMNEIQQWNEQDVLGSMLLKGDMTNALLKDLHSQDFRFKAHREIYHSMKKHQKYGKFYTEDVLEDNLELGKDILYLMDVCLTTNTEIKCQWLLEQSVKRYT